jgi:hypothetical protein
MGNMLALSCEIGSCSDADSIMAVFKPKLELKTVIFCATCSEIITMLIFLPKFNFTAVFLLQNSVEIMEIMFVCMKPFLQAASQIFQAEVII